MLTKPFLIGLLAILLAGPTLLAQNLQFSTNTVLVGNGSRSNPTCVTTININGKLALVSANLSDDTLSVLTNDNTGRYVLSTNLPVGHQPNFVTAADLNNDGQPDLISADTGFSYAGTVTLLTNDGNGKFVFQSTVDVGVSASCVAVADVNADNQPDLIVANQGYYGNSFAGTVTVLTNSGNGSFNTFTNFNVGYQPYYLTMADLNGDGKPDLIVADVGDYGNTTYGDLMIYTNGGSAGLIYCTTLNSGFKDPYCVAVADFNDDGKPDLLTANDYDFSISVLTNSGNLTFNTSTNISLGDSSQSIHYAAAADLNGDGHPDLISVNFSSASLNILTNTGVGNFISTTNVAVGNSPQSLVVTDLNGDGQMDLVSANNSDSSLSVLIQGLPVAPWITALATHPNQIAFSWSASAAFTLQTNGGLTGSNWNTPGYPISVMNGTNYSFTLTSPPPAKLFFRLVYP